MNSKQKTGFIEGGMAVVLDKAPRLNISIVIWILSSDTICPFNQLNTNSEAAMLSRWCWCGEAAGASGIPQPDKTCQNHLLSYTRKGMVFDILRRL